MNKEYHRFLEGKVKQRVISGFDIWDLFPDWCLTSCRRALTDLCNEGKLDKTDLRVMGKYGISVATWRLAQPKQVTQTELFTTETE